MKGLELVLNFYRDTPIESETDQQLARNQHKLAENMYKSRSEAWGRNESGEEETDRCGRQAIIKSKCNRYWQGSDPGSEMTGRSPPDVSERGEISQQRAPRQIDAMSGAKTKNYYSQPPSLPMIITPQHQWSIICSRISQSDHESPAWWLVTQAPNRLV